MLCGGASRRMGRDKALIEVDGTALAVRVADALRAGGCHEVRAVGGDASALEALGLEVVPDAHPGEGPLGGLATALAAAPPGAVLALAPCDLVAPDPAATAQLLGALAAAPPEVDAVVPVVDGRDEWTLSAWRVDPARAAAVAALLADGRRRLAAVAEVAQVVRVHDVERGAVADADRPEDLPAGTDR
ncbi:NTP transferase domain-containing protein [Iamia majanohamensis]|uniref:NTP transferase domain-containing protein n=1 Tax=Iamia majanohamensis TaxID=467976 RepID=A0AAE9Y9H3_9ACTN|nr:NTP transferase domain-containing protein [Iamia majanohamensis]WCO69240.1 NTP transferase domain-containing protein [Iamia majanohamensis]